MRPSDLSTFLAGLIDPGLKISTMIWGPPGIGKSSIVAQTAESFGLKVIDLRLSQLAPTDLRGLPVAAKGVSRWMPPEFLPRKGKGVLFLDEINLAPPVMQGMAQQLILDRRVGSYEVPDGWFIFAAGNRKEDRASVFDMPAPLANRFLHLEVEPDLDSFKAYALERGLPDPLVAFLTFRPALLHKLDAQQPAWPSPRSWEMGAQLFAAGLDIAPAVGSAAATEFRAFLDQYQQLPDLDAVLAGRGNGQRFPDEPSVRYATVIGLAARARDAQRAYHALRWLMTAADLEWPQLFAVDSLRVLRPSGRARDLQRLIAGDDELMRLLARAQQLMS
jgi:MoxR-like ATPase